MNVPPAVLDMRIAGDGRRPFRLWLPIFLLWPLAFALVVLALVAAALADALLFAAGQRYHHYTLLLVRSLEALTETRGMVIRVHGDETVVDMTVV